jgi:hypothetical protein
MITAMLTRISNRPMPRSLFCFVNASCKPAPLVKSSGMPVNASCVSANNVCIIPGLYAWDWSSFTGPTSAMVAVGSNTACRGAGRRTGTSLLGNSRVFVVRMSIYCLLQRIFINKCNYEKRTVTLISVDVALLMAARDSSLRFVVETPPDEVLFFTDCIISCSITWRCCSAY